MLIILFNLYLGFRIKVTYDNLKIIIKDNHLKEVIKDVVIHQV